MAYQMISRWAAGMLLAAGSWVPVHAQTGEEYRPDTTRLNDPDPAAANDPVDYRSTRTAAAETGRPMQGAWRRGAAAGFFVDTPDDAAFALTGDMDYGVTDEVSVGPLAQIGLTGDMFLFGLSGGAKYWIPVADEAHLVLQGGLGFAHADFQNDDTSWLIPLGVGYDYTLGNGTSLTATALMNFTDLAGADFMPGVLLGLRF